MNGGSMTFPWFVHPATELFPLLDGGDPRLGDVIRSEGTNADAKSNHRWGQDYNAFHTLVERLTQAGQTVADPFMGSATTLLAAHALGRHAIGCDIDEAAVQAARERLWGNELGVAS